MMSCVTLTDTRATELPASPRATRHRASVWRDPRLLVGVVLVAVAGLLGGWLLDDEDTVAVWATTRALAAGEPVPAGGLVRREVRFADQVDADRYLSAAAELPAGTVVSRDVGAGELLPREAVAPQDDRPVVEVPLRVAAEAVPLSVGPGSVVDVWVTPSLDRAAAVGADDPALPVLRDVRVLAVSRGGGALGASAARQVVVGLDATQEGELADALAEMAGGDVVLVRRP